MRTLLLLFVMATGCSTVADAPRGDAALVDPPETVDAYYDDRAELMAALDAAIGEARADDAQSCRVVAVGAKACGGPAAYRVYSATDADADEIEDLADRITALDEYANDEFGLASTCDVPLEPSPALVDGRCTASGPR